MRYDVGEVPWELAGEKFPIVIKKDRGTNSPPVAIVSGFDENCFS
jgi:hypothetical protein